MKALLNRQPNARLGAGPRDYHEIQVLPDLLGTTLIQQLIFRSILGLMKLIG